MVLTCIFFARRKKVSDIRKETRLGSFASDDTKPNVASYTDTEYRKEPSFLHTQLSSSINEDREFINKINKQDTSNFEKNEIMDTYFSVPDKDHYPELS